MTRCSCAPGAMHGRDDVRGTVAGHTILGIDGRNCRSVARLAVRRINRRVLRHRVCGRSHAARSPVVTPAAVGSRPTVTERRGLVAVDSDSHDYRHRHDDYCNDENLYLPHGHLAPRPVVRIRPHLDNRPRQRIPHQRPTSASCRAVADIPKYLVPYPPSRPQHVCSCWPRGEHLFP